jgi:GT2 family glycosyltransferase
MVPTGAGGAAAKTGPRPVVVVITGVHRSGTSLLAQILHQLGVGLGDSLELAPWPANADGHWEHSEIWRTQEALLESLGRGFYTPRSVLPLPEGWWRDPAVEPFKERLAGIAREELRKSPGPWGFKDPRSLLLAPMWREILDGLGVARAWAISVRHPLEVARSLATRDGTSAAHGELMWLAYHLSFARHLEGERVAVVAHDAWFETPAATARQLLARLGLEWSGTEEALSGALARIVKPSLRHHERGSEKAGSSLAEETFRRLTERAPSPPDFPALRRLLHPIEEAQRILQPWSDACDSLAATLAEKEALASQLPARDRMIGERDRVIAARNEAISQLQAVVGQRGARIEALEAERSTGGARLGRWLTRQRRRWAPDGTLRCRLFRAAARAASIWHAEGVGGLARRAVARAGMVRVPGTNDAQVIFHAPYYLAQCGRDPDAARNPLQHYLRVGWREGRNPHPLFDTRYYLESSPSVAKADVNPLEHYVRYGWREGLRPCAAFSHYEWLNPDIGNWGRSPLAHYVLHGCRENRPYRRPSAVDVAAANVDLGLPYAAGSSRRPAPPSTAAPRVLAHVHAYYLEHWEQVADGLASIPVAFDLVVTSDAQEKLDAIAASPGLERLGRGAQLLRVPNRGRDLAPLLAKLGRTVLEYDLALHLHVKKSVDRGDPTFGQRWMRHNLDCLLYDREYVAAILSLFRNEPRCGIVQPVPFGPIRAHLEWGANLPIARELLARLGQSTVVLPEEPPLSFPAGSMFWFRPAALAPMLDGRISLDDFPDEPIPEDGTLAHAIERCFVPVARHHGFHERSVSPLPPDELPSTGRRPLVSIVMPVRNGAEYLHAALQSALRQRPGTVPVEILVVDNGSTDATPGIATFYAETFPNVRLLRQTAGGAGAARNLGVENASGRYVFFLDADDLLAQDGIEALHRAAALHGAEVVASRLRMYDERRSRAPAPSSYGLWGGLHDLVALSERADLRDVPEAARAEITDLFSDFGPCAKLYEREYLRRSAIRFPESGNYEDNAFVYEAYLKARRLVQVRDVTYLYRKFRARKGRSQSTGLGGQDVRDQIARLGELAGKAEAIANRELAQVLRSSLLKKLSWWMDADRAVAGHLQALSADTEALLRRIDGAADASVRGAVRDLRRRIEVR